MAHNIINNLEQLLSNNMKDIQHMKASLKTRASSQTASDNDDSLSIPSDQGSASNMDMPYPWEMHYSEEYQRMYYYNNETGESSWEKPIMEQSNHLDRKSRDTVVGSQYAIDPDYAGVVDKTEALRGSSEARNGYSMYGDQETSDYLKGIHQNTSHGVQSSAKSIEQSNPQFSAPVNAQRFAQSNSTNLAPYSSNERPSVTNPNSSSKPKKQSIADRATEQLQLKREKEESMRQYLEQKEVEQLKSAPSITTKSKQLQRGVNDMLSWEDARKAKIEAMQQQREQQLALQQTGKPITNRSNPTARQSQSHSRPAIVVTGGGGSVHVTSGAAVHERLYDLDEKRRQRQAAAIEKAAEDARLAAVPKVAPHSAAAKREQQGPVAERLYNVARQRQFEQDLYAPQGSSAQVYHDPATGQRLFQPKINKTSEKLAGKARPPVAIEDLLYHKGAEYQQRAKARELRQELNDQMVREAPKINEISERIVAERMMYDGESTGDRLARPIGAIKQKTLETIDVPTFKPTISKKSKEIVESRVHVYGQVHRSGSGSQRSVGQSSTSANTYYASSLHSVGSGVDYDDISYQSGGPRGIDARSDSQSWADNDVDENISLVQLAFELPVESSSQAHLDDESHSEYWDGQHSMRSEEYNSSDPVIYSKSLRWVAEREERLERERKQREKEELAQCSFRPNLHEANAFGAGAENQSSGGGSIADRQAAWANSRAQKLEIERKKREQDALKECSFAPSLRSQPSSSTRSSSAGRLRPGGSSKSLSGSNDGKSTGSQSRSPTGRQSGKTTGKPQLAKKSEQSTGSADISSSWSSFDRPGEGYYYAQDDLDSTWDSASSRAKIKIPSHGSTYLPSHSFDTEESNLAKQYADASAATSENSNSASYPLSAEDLMDLMDETDQVSGGEKNDDNIARRSGYDTAGDSYGDDDDFYDPRIPDPTLYPLPESPPPNSSPALSYSNYSPSGPPSQSWSSVRYYESSVQSGNDCSSYYGEDDVPPPPPPPPFSDSPSRSNEAEFGDQFTSIKGSTGSTQLSSNHLHVVGAPGLPPKHSFSHFAEDDTTTTKRIPPRIPVPTASTSSKPRTYTFN